MHMFIPSCIHILIDARLEWEKCALDGATGSSNWIVTENLGSTMVFTFPLLPH